MSFSGLQSSGGERENYLLYFNYILAFFMRVFVCLSSNVFLTVLCVALWSVIVAFSGHIYSLVWDLDSKPTDHMFLQNALIEILKHNKI